MNYSAIRKTVTHEIVGAIQAGTKPWKPSWQSDLSPIKEAIQALESVLGPMPSSLAQALSEQFEPTNPPKTTNRKPDAAVVNTVESLFRKTRARYRYNNAIQAPFYRSRPSDHIELPEPGRFADDSSYASAAFHELVHWTGHPKRLNRDGISITKPMDMDSPVYAFEELVAELGAVMLCKHFGVAYDLDHHASYVEHWLKALLRNDPDCLEQASRKAEAAVRYLTTTRS